MKCPFCEIELSVMDSGALMYCQSNACKMLGWPITPSIWNDLTAAVEESNKRAVERHKQEIAAKGAIAERPGWTQHVDTWWLDENTKVRVSTNHITRRFSVSIPMGGEQILRAYEFETPDDAMAFAERAMELVKGATK